MNSNKKYMVCVLLLVSGMLLSSLVPGGPVENRDFSQISPSILLVFNIYLTVLGLGSFALIAYILRSGLFSGLLAAMAGLSYLIIYGIDLLGWFPQTPSEMSTALFRIEILGMMIALPLTYLSCLLSGNRSVVDHDVMVWSLPKVVAVVVAGIAIVVFATWSAMTPKVSSADQATVMAANNCLHAGFQHEYHPGEQQNVASENSAAISGLTAKKMTGFDSILWSRCL